VTGLVVVHFVAILTAVTSAGNPRFPAPQLAVEANIPFRPYLQMLFLSNPYRFYAPDPGPTNVFWFRLKHQYRDEHGEDVIQWRWVEMPDRSQFANRMPYQRHLSLTMLFDNQRALVTTPLNQAQAALTEEAKLVLSSYVRHAARAYPLRLPDGTEAPVKAVEFYNTYHAVLHPDQIKAGLDTYDLRLYLPNFYGQFTPEGSRIDSPMPLNGKQMWMIQERSISDLAAQILYSDLYPVFRKDQTTDRMEIMEKLGTPTPIRALLMRFPQLKDPDTPQADLKNRIEEFVLSGPKAPVQVKKHD
jgi:hypothetical protein